jgi:hypothetical protein
LFRVSYFVFVSVLLNRDNWPAHRPWLIFCLIATALASVWFFAAGIGAPDWPSGSSLPGFTFGVLGGLIIVFEFLLWLRKKVRVWRIGRAQKWMRAHIWLGLLCVPLLIYHSGFRLGGTLSAVLLLLLLVVVASGIWGLALQQLLPRQMLDEIPAETIYSQIDHLSSQLLAEGERLVRAVCGPAPGEERLPLAPDETGSLAPADHVVVGAVRSVGRVQGKVLEARTSVNPVADAESLRVFFHGRVVPFLRGADPKSPLHSPARLKDAFQDLRTKLPAAAHASADALEEFCNQRRQWAQQARLHFWLHNWLWVHFPLSVALVVLMIVHIWVALKYW